MVTPNLAPRVRADWLPRAVVAGFIAAVAMLFAFMLAYAFAYLIAGLPPGPPVHRCEVSRPGSLA